MPSSSQPVIRTKRPIRDILPLGETMLVQHDDAARLYDATTGALVRELATGPLGHHERGLALHPDGTSVLVTTSTQVARFDLATGERREHAAVTGGTGAVVTATGQLLLIGELAASSEIVLFAWSGGQDPTVLAEFGQYHNAVGLTLGPDGDHVWLSLSTFVARVRLSDGEVWRTPRDERCLDQPVCLEPSNSIAVGTLDGRVQFWCDAAETADREVSAGPDTLHRVRTARLRGGILVAATAADQRISILAPGDARPRVRLEGPRTHLDALVSDGGTRLWAGASDGSIWHFDVSGMDLAPAPNPSRKKPPFPLTNHPTTHATALELLAPGKAVTSDSSGGLCLWERGDEDARTYRRPKPDPTLRAKYAIYQITTSSNYIVVRESSSGFVVLDASSLEVVTKIPHKGATKTVTDGTTLITTGDELVQSFRVGTWEKIGERAGVGSGTSAEEWIDIVRAVSFRDERGVVGLIGVDDLKTRMSRSFGDATYPGTLVADRDGTCLAFDFYDEKRSSRVRIWELATGKLTTLPLESPRSSSVSSPRFIGDELVVVSRSSDGASYRIHWLGRDGTPHRHFDVCTSVDTSVAYLRLLAAREDVLVFDIGDELAVLDSKTGDLRRRHRIEGDVVKVVFDDDAVVALTNGGRATWLDIAR